MIALAFAGRDASASDTPDHLDEPCGCAHERERTVPLFVLAALALARRRRRR